MALQVINIGTRANDGTGDPLRTAFAKAEANFTELFSAVTYENITVNLDDSMTTAEMQALIDAQPRNLNGKNLTVQFADGTYTLTAPLVFRFFVGGLLEIQGNPADNTLSSTKAVNLLGAYSAHTLSFESCGPVRLRYLRASCGDGDGVTTPVGIRMFNCGYANVHFVATTNQTGLTTAGKGYGIFFDHTHGEVWTSHFSAMEVALACWRGHVLSIGNASGVASLFGLVANAGIIFKTGTQPSGTTAEATSNGGQIFA